MVDQNRIKGAAQDAMGTVEESAGGLTGDTETQAPGKGGRPPEKPRMLMEELPIKFVTRAKRSNRLRQSSRWRCLSLH